MEWKIEWLGKIIELCNEYQALDGLEDATRASQIPDEILDIVEKEIRDEMLFELQELCN